MSSKPYVTMESFHFPNQPTTASLGDQLILHDSLESEIQWEGTETTDFAGQSIKLRNTMTLFFCLEGEVQLQQGTEECVMRKNDVIFTKSGLFGKVESMSRDLKYFLIIMNEKFYYPIFSSINMSTLQKELTTRPVCHLSQQRANECLSLFQMLKQRLNSHVDDELQELIVKGYLQALTFNVYSAYLKASKQESLMAGEQDRGKEQLKQSRQQDLFNRFMALLQEHYTQERNIKFYADKLFITPRYLSRIINEVSGHFASEHIDLFVIAEAKQLIRSKQYTILQVSEMLNFTSPSFFGRYFKKFTGYTPKQYQELE